MLNGNKSDETLIRLLKKVKPDTPTREFVNLVMEELALKTQSEEISEVKFASLLKSSTVEKPSVDFTNDLMRQIKSEANPVDDPIISKTGWYAIVITLGITLIIIGYSGSNNSTSNTSNVASTHFGSVGQSLTSTIAQIHSFPSVFYLVLIPLCLLLLADYFLLNKRIDPRHSYS